MDEVYSTEVQFVGDDLYNRGNLRDMVHKESFTTKGTILQQAPQITIFLTHPVDIYRIVNIIFYKGIVDVFLRVSLIVVWHDRFTNGTLESFSQQEYTRYLLFLL